MLQRSTDRFASLAMFRNSDIAMRKSDKTRM
jgi:hypothetical protein